MTHKRSLLYVTGRILVLVLSAGMLLTGWAKEVTDIASDGSQASIAELGFHASVLSAPQPWTAHEVSTRSRASGTAENLPAGAEVLVRVYPMEDGRANYSIPIKRGVYVVAADGTASPKGEADRITLCQGNYTIDFTYPSHEEQDGTITSIRTAPFACNFFSSRLSIILCL